MTMAEIKRDIFPTHVLSRIQTPVQRRRCVSNLQICRDRPWGAIVYPVAQQQGKGRNG
jgi:hypothetical protein